MSLQKMLVVTLAKTHGVLAAVTRSQSGVPALEELLSEGLFVRYNAGDDGVLVPASELEIKEVDLKDAVFRTPRIHVVDPSAVVLSATSSVSSVVLESAKVTVKVSVGAPADKAVLALINVGPGHPPVVATGKTTLNATETAISVSGISSGNHVVLASVEGYGALVTSVVLS